MESLAELARVLRELRRRHARQAGGGELTYRQLAAATGWSHGIIGEYLTGKVLPPTDRFDILVRLLGASPAEQGTLATARDRIEELRRHALPTGGSGAGLPEPRQLPAGTAAFTGRTAPLAQLDALLDSPRPTPAPAPDPVPVALITGSPGVGKTALAVYWAHRVADRFPDGQLYLDLRGYDPQQPVAPATALAGFLRALGLSPALIPQDVAELAGCYRTLLAGRRMLVVLDNAHTADQVRPLLPGTGASMVVVTSRDVLAGLVVRDGAHRIELAVLSTGEAATLLRTLIGTRVAIADPDLAVLADRCARLPLALRVAAEVATSHPDLTLPELLAELGDQQRRLDLLGATGEARSAVRAVFSWSYGRLTAGAARAFALLGLHPGPTAGAGALAALAGTSTAAARAMLAELQQAHLVEPAGPDEYTMHDLLRAYAAEQATGWADQTGQQDALARLLTYYLDTAMAATSVLFPHDHRPPREPSAPLLPNGEDPGWAQQWLDRNRANLVAAGTYAERHHLSHHCVQLSETLWRYLEVGGHHQEALALHTAAVAAAAAGSRDAAVALANLGGVHWWLGSYHDARDCYLRSLSGHRAAGDAGGAARALARLGVVYERLGDYPAARRHLREALAGYRAAGDRHGAGCQLVNLGAVLRRTGRYEEAAALQQEAAAVFAGLGDRRLEGYARGNLGVVYGLLGRTTEALAELTVALRRCRERADPGGEGSALGAIGAVRARLGHHREALASLHQALASSRGIADRGVETEVLNTLGETLRAMGQPAAALARHAAALDLARLAADRYEHARARDGMARASAALGQADQARQYLREALDLYQRLGVPEAADARAFSKELR